MLMRTMGMVQDELTDVTSRGDIEVVKLLLGNRVDINYRNGFPLRLALSTGNKRMIELFTEHMTSGSSVTYFC